MSSSETSLQFTDQLVDEKWMEVALSVASRAGEVEEVPVGAILVRDYDQQLVAASFNQTVSTNNVSTLIFYLISSSWVGRRLVIANWSV